MLGLKSMIYVKYSEYKIHARVFVLSTRALQNTLDLSYSALYIMKNVFVCRREMNILEDSSV
jgi:hypothetical protein